MIHHVRSLIAPLEKPVGERKKGRVEEGEGKEKRGEERLKW
jgi:hypothetical protein